MTSTAANRSALVLPALLLQLVASAAGADASGDATVPAPTGAAPTAAREAVAIDPVFDCFRLNYAWGFALQGTLIDRDGNILRYRMGARDLSPQPIPTQGETTYAAPDLRRKFHGAERTGKVDAGALAANIALAATAASGTITVVDTGTRDAGTSTCHAYLADAANVRYRDVMLGSDDGAADTRTLNSAPAAQRVLDWLRSVGVAY